LFFVGVASSHDNIAAGCRSHKKRLLSLLSPPLAKGGYVDFEIDHFKAIER
jgi:hypothetical protein